MQIDVTDAERTAMSWLISQVSLKVGPENLEVMVSLVSLQKKLAANEPSIE